jgi:hypothetical protein
MYGLNQPYTSPILYGKKDEKTRAEGIAFVIVHGELQSKAGHYFNG